MDTVSGTNTSQYMIYVCVCSPFSRVSVPILQAPFILEGCKDLSLSGLTQALLGLVQLESDVS